MLGVATSHKQLKLFIISSISIATYQQLAMLYRRHIPVSFSVVYSSTSVINAVLNCLNTDVYSVYQ